MIKAEVPKYGVLIQGIKYTTFLFLCEDVEKAIKEKQEEYK